MYAFTVLTLLALQAPAGVLVPVHGVLTDDQGTPISGPTSLTFRIWRDATPLPDADGGVPDGGDDDVDDAGPSSALLFEETLLTLIDDGAFFLYLGETVALPPEVFAANRFTSLTVEVDGQELPPISLGSAPFAAWADRCGDADWAATADAVSFLSYDESSGYLGVGTDAPEDTLHVEGGLLLDGVQTVYGDGHRLIFDGDTIIGGTDRAGGGRDIELKAGGNVYFGSAAPGGSVILRAGHTNTSSGNAACPWVDRNNHVLIYAGGNTFTGICSSKMNGDIRMFAGYNTFSGVYTEVVRVVGETGRVGIGTTTPDYKLEVAGEVGAANFVTVSDARFKQQIVEVSGASATVERLRPVRYRWNEAAPFLHDEREHYGFLAQDLREVLPSLVDETSDGSLRIRAGEVVPLLVAAVQEEHARVATLEAENAALQQRLDDVERALKQVLGRVSALEADAP